MELILAVAYLLPLIILSVFIGHADRRFILYIFWGFLASVPVLVLFPVLSSALPTVLYPSVTLSPLIEEFFKALPLLVLAGIGAKNTDRDVLACAMASGVGFSIIENWIFLDPGMLSVTAGNFFVLLTRSFSTSLMHACTSGIIGYGIVLIRNFDRRALPALLFGLYTLAVLIHALYNLLSEYFGVAGIIIDLIFPVVLFFLLASCYHVDVPALFHEGRSM